MVSDTKAEEAWHCSEDGEDPHTEVGEDTEFADFAFSVFFVGERE